MFKNDTMEQYVADSRAALSAAQPASPPDPDFGEFAFFGPPRVPAQAAPAQVIPFPCSV